MTEAVVARDKAPSDADLIVAVRDGDTEAYAALFDRHRDAAGRLARHLVRSPDSDDLVSEAFTRILALLQAGQGPHEAFRAYLLTVVRRLHVDRVRASARVRPTDDERDLDRVVTVPDPVELAFESGTAAAAFASLPERWQTVLWHLDVEGEKPAAVAPVLGMSPNSVSALAYRAREGLREAYLHEHLADAANDRCRACRTHLAGYVRRTLSARDTATVDAHLDECRACTGLYLELVEVNRDLGGLLLPALIGVSAAGYLAGASALGSAGTAGAVGIKAVLGTTARGVVEPIKALAASAGSPVVAVAGVVVAGVAATGVVLVTTGSSEVAPAPAVAAPAASADPSPTPSEPTPTPSPSPTPTPVLLVEASPEPAVAAPTVDTPPEPAPEPSPPVPPVGVTDFGIGPISYVAESLLLQRRIMIPVTAESESHPVARDVRVRVDLGRRARFQGTGGAWRCDVPVGRRFTTLNCSATLPAGRGDTLVLRLRGLAPRGTATVTAPDDPSHVNDTRTFRTGLLLLG